MFFVLSKILDFFLQPISWIIFINIILLSLKSRKIIKQLLLLHLLIVLVLSNGLFTNFFYNCWEKPYKTKLDKSYPAGVVLTGGIIQSNGKESESIHFGPHADRLMQAAILYKKGLIQKIIISGGNVSIKGSLIKDHTNESVKSANYLKIIGIPDSVIYIESKSRNTFENALYSKKFMDSLGIKDRIVLITAADHMKRASACFTKQGILHVIFPAIKIGKDASTGILSDFVPEERNLYQNQLLIREIVGYYIYKLMGYC